MNSTQLQSHSTCSWWHWSSPYFKHISLSLSLSLSPTLLFLTYTHQLNISSRIHFYRPPVLSPTSVSDHHEVELSGKATTQQVVPQGWPLALRAWDSYPLIMSPPTEQCTLCVSHHRLLWLPAAQVWFFNLDDIHHVTPPRWRKRLHVHSLFTHSERNHTCLERIGFGSLAPGRFWGSLTAGSVRRAVSGIHVCCIELACPEDWQWEWYTLPAKSLLPWIVA